MNLNRPNQNPTNQNPNNRNVSIVPPQQTARITITGGNLFGTTPMNQGNFLNANETLPPEFYQTSPGGGQAAPIQPPQPQTTPRQKVYFNPLKRK
jgi:hypothetical protein